MTVISGSADNKYLGESADAGRPLTIPAGGHPKNASLFCVLQHVAGSNALNTAQVLRRYSAVGDQAEFRRPKDFRLDAIQRDCGFSPAQMRSTDAGFFLPTLELAGRPGKSLADALSPNLRVCPTCIDADYHTALHQWLELPRCLLHKDSLTEKCPGCGAIRPYLLKVLRATPWSCKCSPREWQQVQSQARRAPWIHEMDAVLLDVLGWTAAARSTISLTPNENELLIDEGRHKTVLVDAQGTGLEEFLTAAALCGAAGRPPEMFASTFFSIDIFEMEQVRTKNDRKNVKCVVRGQRATARFLDETVIRPDMMFPAREILGGHINHMLRVLTLAAAQQHEACIRLEEQAAELPGGTGGDHVCPVAAVLRALTACWQDRWFAEFAQKLMYREECRYRRGLWGLEAKGQLYGELASYELHRRVAVLITALRDGIISVEQALHQIQESGDEFEVPFALSAFAGLKGSEFRYGLRAAVLERIDWQRAWAEFTKCKEDHLIESQQRFAALLGRSQRIRRTIDGVRGRGGRKK